MVIVVRHGLTAWNAEGRLQGQTDIPLAPVGKAQALSLGRRLARAWSTPGGPIPGPPSAVYTSDLSRASETASIVLAAVRDRQPSVDPPIHITPLLRERHFGPWEGLTADEARAQFGTERSYRTEGEPLSAVRDRMELVVNRIKADSPATEDRVVLVVGHGGSLRQLVCVACAWDLDAARRFHLDNTGLSVLEFGGSAASIRLWNDTAHLVYDP